MSYDYTTYHIYMKRLKKSLMLSLMYITVISVLQLASSIIVFYIEFIDIIYKQLIFLILPKNCGFFLLNIHIG